MYGFHGQQALEWVGKGLHDEDITAAILDRV